MAFDTTLQAPLMIAFFTSIGFGASVPLLRSGGPAVAVFLALATAVAVLQNLAGAAVAAGLGVPPLLGVLAGSVTLTGGPATGLAFAPLFEQAGVKGAATLAVASAMVGIVTRRDHRRPDRHVPHREAPPASRPGERPPPRPPRPSPPGTPSSRSSRRTPSLRRWPGRTPGRARCSRAS